MGFKIALVRDGVFPEAPLPDVALAMFSARGGDSIDRVIGSEPRHASKQNLQAAHPQWKWGISSG